MVIERVRSARAFLTCCAILACIGLVLCLTPALARAQLEPLPDTGLSGQPFYFGRVTWRVFGRVTNVRGDPLGDVRVRVGVTSAGMEPRDLKTNLLGEFSTEYTLDSNMFTNLDVRIVASLSGYLPATEMVGYKLDQKMSAIHPHCGRWPFWISSPDCTKKQPAG